MEKLNFKNTLSLANQLYKKSFKIAFLLAFMLSFISEYMSVYLLNHGLVEFVQSNGETLPANFPSSDIILMMVITIILATLFVYGMIIILHGIYSKQSEIKLVDSFIISLQIFAKRVLPFIGVFVLSMIAMSILTMLFRYIGIYIAILLFITVLPAVLIGSEPVFKAITSNFKIIKRDFFFMLRVTFIILALMTLKPILMYVFMNGLELMQVNSNSIEMSVQNIVMTVIDALILPYIFAVSVATYLSANSSNKIENTSDNHQN